MSGASVPPQRNVGPVNIVKGSYPELVAFLVLNIVPSHFGLPALIALVTFSKKVHRHPTFINLCVAFILTGISSSLLLYAGRITGPEPDPFICLLQASLLYGMPPFTSMAVFMLVLQVFLVIRAAFHGYELSKKTHAIRLWAMIVTPYVAYFIAIFATASVGAANPTKVNRNRRFFYCSVEANPLTNTLTIASAMILLATLILQVWTLVLFYRHWKALKRDGRQQKLDLAMPARVLGFGFYLMVALSLSLLSIKSPESPIPDVIIACASPIVVLIFGTQKDILDVICFWRTTKVQQTETKSSDKRWIGKPQLIDEP